MPEEKVGIFKAGWKTSEFWLVLIGGALKALEAQLGIDLPNEALLALAAYVLGRSWVKASAEKAKAEKASAEAYADESKQNRLMYEAKKKAKSGEEVDQP